MFNLKINTSLKYFKFSNSSKTLINRWNDINFQPKNIHVNEEQKNDDNKDRHPLPPVKPPVVGIKKVRSDWSLTVIFITCSILIGLVFVTCPVLINHVSLLLI